ncbi:hypothetical protein [Limnospira platensis]|uniref:hypothetical protein n=1 Tax=Limnospira platensis TaxID=118562 RepID=UPI003D701797
MIAVNSKPIGSFLTIDCYHVGRTPKSVCSGWGGGYVSKSTTTTAEDNSPSYQRYTYQCTKISDRLSVSDYESMVAIARKVIYGSDS